MKKVRINNKVKTKFTLLMRNKKIRIGFFAFLGIIVFTFLIGNLTKIRSVHVTGTPARVEIDSKTLPQNLLFFPVDKVRNKLLLEYPQFEDIKIYKKFPQTLEVELIAREPMAILETSGRKVYVDEQGWILKDTENTDKPIIELDNYQIKGTKIDHPFVNTSLAFLAGMAQYDDIKRIFVDQDTLRIQTSDMMIILSEKRDGSESARTLQSLITGFRIRGSLPKIIDMRFDQPVVTW